jgi:hypothetical protein
VPRAPAQYEHIHAQPVPGPTEKLTQLFAGWMCGIVALGAAEAAAPAPKRAARTMKNFILKSVDAIRLDACQFLPHNCRGHCLQQLRGLFGLVIICTAVVATRAVDGAERLLTATRKRRQVQLLLTAIVFAAARHGYESSYLGNRSNFSKWPPCRQPAPEVSCGPRPR